MSLGRYIVIEGPTGSSNTEQVLLLSKKLKQMGYPVRVFNKSKDELDILSKFIHTLTDDSSYHIPKRAEALFNSAVINVTLEKIRNAREEGYICLSNYSFLTMLAVQYYGRGDIQDYQALTHIIDFANADTNPDITIVLDAPVHILRDQSTGEYRDESLLERLRAGYLWEANKHQYPVIFANNAPEKITEAVWQTLQGKLRSPKGTAPSAPPLSISSEPTPIKHVLEQKKGTIETEDSRSSTEEGYVSNETSDIYMFTNNIPDSVATEILTRFSKEGGNIRSMLRDVNYVKSGKIEPSLSSEYILVVENCSELLALELEQSKLIDFVEQPSRIRYLDKKDANGHYPYFVPKQLPRKLKATYRASMDDIFSLYAEMMEKLTLYIQDHGDKEQARGQAEAILHCVLPVATKTTVAMKASGLIFENSILQVMSNELSEVREAGEALLLEVRKTNPTFLEQQASKPDHAELNVAYRTAIHKNMQILALKELPNTLGVLDDDTRLVDVWPRNELDLVPHMLYEHSSMGLKDLKREMQTWSYDRKLEIFNTYMGERLNRNHLPGRALEIARYSWDLITDFSIFRYFQQLRITDAMNWQALTPRYGFDIPELVEKAELTEQFEKCFDKSAELYSLLQSQGFHQEAQYTTLLGHRLRWKISYNAQEAFHLHELRTSPQSHQGYRQLVKEMHDKLTEVHPMLATAMKFVNKN